jgi:hypothetical protein
MVILLLNNSFFETNINQSIRTLSQSFCNSTIARGDSRSGRMLKACRSCFFVVQVW